MRVARPGRLQLDPEGKARLKKRANAPKKPQQPLERDLTAAKVLSFFEENPSISEADTRSYLEFGNELVRLLHQTILTELHSEDLLNSVFDIVFSHVLDDDYRVRTLTLRILRLVAVSERPLRMYLENGLDIVLVRTLDVNDLPECERLEALKIVTQLLVLFRQQKTDDDSPPVPTTFPGNVLTVLTAIAMQRLPTFDESKDDSVANDGIGLAALAILLELSVSNPLLVIETVGTEWLLRSLIGPGANNSRYTALSCHVLTKWLDSAEIRERAELNLFLEQMLAPLVDIGFFQGPSKESQLIRNEAFDMSANVFLNLLRTWAGLFSCAANDDGANGRTSSPLMLLEYLGLGRVVNANMLKVRDMIVDICCEFLDMPYATRKFSSWQEVKLFYAEMHLPDAYKCSLRDNFVVGEVNTYTASEQSCHGEVDLLRSFRALATFILVSTGLPQGSMFLPSDWRMRIVSAPTLVQSATETFFGGHASDSEVDSNGGGGASDKGNALLLLHRLDRLSEIWQSRADISTQLHNINLFVLSGKPPSPPKEIDEKRELLEHHLVSALEKSFSTDDKMPDWLHVQTALQCFEADPGLLEKLKHSDKCHSFFSEIYAYLMPSAKTLVHDTDDRISVHCGCRAFRLATPLAESEPHYAEMVEKFIADFCRQLDPSNVYRGTFAPKNLLNTLAMYYFAFINAISASKTGYEMLEKSGIFQIMLDLVTSSASMEYVKLIVSCLDYSRPGPARGVLETVLTASNESSRRWTTRFLEVLACFDAIHDFGDFGMDLLFRQLTDASPKVVRHAVRLLSTLVPKYPQCLKQLSSVRFEAFGDAGALLESHLFVDEHYVMHHTDHSKRVVERWSTTFNSRYVELIEDEMRVVFLNVKRSLDGRFARVSNERRVFFGMITLERRSLKPPNHLFGSLAKHSAGRRLLLEEGVLKSLLSTLEQSPRTDERCVEVKAALLALGHIVGNLPRDVGIEWDVANVITPMVHEAESSTWLSIRGIAFWALNIAGEGDLGSEALESVGWCNNRRSCPLGGKVDTEQQDRGELLVDDLSLDAKLFPSSSNMRVQAQDGRSNNLPHLERQSLVAYRCVLAEAGEIAAFDDVSGSERSRQVPTAGNGTSKIILPSNVRRLSQGIFTTGTSNSGRLKATAVNVMQGHVTDRCFICRRGRDPVDFVGSEVDKAYHEQRAEILHIVSMLEIRENANQNRLLKIFKESDVFAHPCLYADALELMCEFNYSTDSRKILHQLFWKALHLP